MAIEQRLSTCAGRLRTDPDDGLPDSGHPRPPGRHHRRGAADRCRRGDPDSHRGRVRTSSPPPTNRPCCFEELQTELWEGPCLAAYETGEAVAIADLAHDTAFPRFAARASAAGLAAVFTFPLRQETGRLGALDLYWDHPRAPHPGGDGRRPDPGRRGRRLSAERPGPSRSHRVLRPVAHENSLHDSLTGLPNRALLIQRLDHAILRSRRSKKTAAILFADLDRFKDGQRHLRPPDRRRAARRGGRPLSRLLRPGDTLARLAGDEFVILCEDLDDAVPGGTAGRPGSAPRWPDPFATQRHRGAGQRQRGHRLRRPGLRRPRADHPGRRHRHVPGQAQGRRPAPGWSTSASSVWPAGRPASSRDLRGARAAGELRHRLPTDRGDRQTGGSSGSRPCCAGPTRPGGRCRRRPPSPSPSGQASSSSIGRWVIEQALLDRQALASATAGTGTVHVGQRVGRSAHGARTSSTVVAAVLADTDTDPATADPRGHRERPHQGQRPGPGGARRPSRTSASRSGPRRLRHRVLVAQLLKGSRST